MAETINGLCKTEAIRRRGPWRTLEAVKFATLEWVDWFNHRRLLEPSGNISPHQHTGPCQITQRAVTPYVAAGHLRHIGRRQTAVAEGGLHLGQCVAVAGRQKGGGIQVAAAKKP